MALSDSNPLNEAPKARKVLYKVQWGYNGVLVIIAAVLGIQGMIPNDLPVWYVYMTTIPPLVWTYLGITADSNVTGKTPEGKSLNPPPAG